MNDLANTPSTPTAVIVPALSLGYIYLVYMIFIALPSGDTRVYVYSIEDQNWASWTIDNANIGIPAKCWIGDQPITAVTTQQIISGLKTRTGTGGITGGGGGGGTGGGGGGHGVSLK